MLAKSTVFCARAAVTYSMVDVIGHIGTVQLISHGIIHSTFASVTGPKGIVTTENEAEV